MKIFKVGDKVRRIKETIDFPRGGIYTVSEATRDGVWIGLVDRPMGKDPTPWHAPAFELVPPPVDIPGGDTSDSSKSEKGMNPKDLLGGTKKDSGKPGMDLLPYDGLVEVAKVLDFGAKKYSPGNWAKGIDLSRLIAAAERHIGELKEGRDLDPESGLGHAAHAACSLLFIIWMLKHRPERDNRWIKEVNR